MVNSAGSYDIFVATYALREFPKVEAINTLSIGGSRDDTFKSVSACKDGGYYALMEFEGNIQVGDATFKASNYGNALVIKYNKTREVEWINSFGDDHSNTSDVIHPYSICTTKDGGCVVVGDINWGVIDLGDFILNNDDNDNVSFVVKYSSVGNIEWVKTIGGSNYEHIPKVCPTNDGGCVVVGKYKSDNLSVGKNVLTNSGGYDGIIIKYNSFGVEEWVNSINGAGNDQINSICTTLEGEFIVIADFTGSSTNVSGSTVHSTLNKTQMIIKYNEDGEVVWLKSPIGNANTELKDICETNDGGYVIVGHSDNSFQIDDFQVVNHTWYYGVVLKINKIGEVEWATSILGEPNTRKYSVCSTKDGGFIVGGYAGQTYKDEDVEGFLVKKLNRESGYVIKFNCELQVEFVEAISLNGFYQACELSNKEIIIAGLFSDSSVEIGNNTLSNSGGTDGVLARLRYTWGAKEQEEVLIENNRKELNITTDINETGDTKGGTISGEDKKAYEIVKYGDDSSEPIEIIPNSGYEIVGITINGEEWQFEPLQDGSYVMPQFTNVTENKHIVVTFALSDNKITINKIDSYDNTKKIEGVVFNIDQIEERTPPVNNDIIGSVVSDGPEIIEQDLTNEVTSTTVGSLYDNGTYYFVNDSGTLIPTNSKTYQLANGGTGGIQSVTANSYIPINLSGLSGDYVVVVNARCSSESADYGYATIKTDTTAPAYNEKPGRFMYISRTVVSRDYISGALSGGSTYYLHLGYRKDGSVDTNEDQVVINSVKVYKAIVNSYGMNLSNGEYTSTNSAKDDSDCSSYIPINLNNYSGKYNITVNADVSTTSGDYGYVVLDESTSKASYNTSESNGGMIKITGINSIEAVKEVQGGSTYYLHMGYYKDSTTNTTGEDYFRINSINISLSSSELHHTTVTTNSDGQAITQIPFGKYQISENSTLEGYWPADQPTIVEFRSGNNAMHEFTIQNEKKGKITVHHYLKNTTTQIADDQEIYGRIGETYYTSPNLSINNYTLEKDQLGEYIVPNNSTGLYTYSDIEVNYYYVEKDVPLTVHHYIEGTENQVPLANGTIAQDILLSGPKNTPYSTSAIQDSLLNENYELKEIPSNATGTYAGDEIIVTYYYKLVEREVIITKVDEDGTTPLNDVEFLLYHPSENVVLEGELTSNGTYYMIKQEDKLIPSNVGMHSTTSCSYIPIDMRRATSSALLTVNAEISSQASYDIGYAIVNESKSAPAYNTSTGRLIYISGSIEAQDYTMVLQPGKIYYLHMGYRKNGSTNTGTDTFTINSITLNGSQPLNSYTTDLNGQISLKLTPGEYVLDEITTLSNYSLPSNPGTAISINKSSNTQEITLTNNKKRGTVIVHHYIEGTTNNVPTQVGGTVSDITKEGIIGTSYATQQANNVSAYFELVGTPANSSGEYIDGQIEVIYYYRKIKGSVSINVNKDNASWSNSGVSIALYQDGEEKYSYSEATVSGNVITWDMVDVGTYDIYANKNENEIVLIDTNQDIVVD